MPYPAHHSALFEERKRDHHDKNSHNDTDIGEVLAAVPVGDRDQLVETDEDHYSGDERDRSGEDEGVQEGQEDKNSENRTERRSHPSKERVETGLATIARGAIEWHRAGYAFRDIVESNGDGDGYTQFYVR